MGPPRQAFLNLSKEEALVVVVVVVWFSIHFLDDHMRKLIALNLGNYHPLTGERIRRFLLILFWHQLFISCI